MLRFVLLLVLGLWSFPALADATYRDPRQPSFTLLIPDGWAVNRTDDGVVLSHGSASLRLEVLVGSNSPGAMLMQLRPQFERQWKDFHEAAVGRASFGGQPANFAVYAGVPPSGVRGVLRVVATTNGRLTFVAFESVHEDEYPAMKPTLDRIEASFTPDPVH